MNDKEAAEQSILYETLRDAQSQAETAFACLRIANAAGVTTFAHQAALARYIRAVDAVHTARCDLDYARIVNEQRRGES